ncbi:hypothetical protein, partial [Pseudomonas aeruginosa]|uniref:hypothetical protein n=1 Tax=Pseudomonas aeruginosa TaxID=287 RepID=UPI00345ABA0D
GFLSFVSESPKRSSMLFPAMPMRVQPGTFRITTGAPQELAKSFDMSADSPAEYPGQMMSAGAVACGV